MKTPTGSNYSQPPTSYPPSVPLCVYRELTAELQAVQSKLDVVTSHNQKLVQENQQLRQEITKMIQSCLELQKLIDAPAPSSPAVPHHNNEVRYQPQPTPRNNNEIKYTNKLPVPAAPPRQQAPRPRPEKVKKVTPPSPPVRRQESTPPIININSPKSEPVFIQEEEVRYYPHPPTKGLNGWWLVITIILIMVTGFSAGYLIVRPLFQSHSQQ
jgi:hypothetical protein